MARKNAMKSLVVDDELVSRKKMEKILSTLGECRGAESGVLALSEFSSCLEKGSPFDLITLDISMPEMDGVQVLGEIRAMEEQRKIGKEKRVKVIMVTCRTDQDVVITSIKAGCDDYVVKPFDRGIVAKKMEKLGFAVSSGPEPEMSARRLVMETVEEFDRGKIKFPFPPRILHEIQNAIEGPSGSAEVLAGIIEKNPVLSINFISAANSPIFRAAERVEGVSNAFRRLGLSAGGEIASMVGQRCLYETKTKNKDLLDLIQRLWLHSLACAYVVKALLSRFQSMAGSGQSPAEERVFTMGLIHDIGCTVLLKRLGEKPALQDVALDRGELLTTLREIHTTFGGELLKSWGFSQNFIEIAKLHESTEFGTNTKKELLMVALADSLTSGMGFGFFEDNTTEPRSMQSASLLQMQADLLEEACHEARGGIERALCIFR